jgi:hypothetical protein
MHVRTYVCTFPLSYDVRVPNDEREKEREREETRKENEVCVLYPLSSARFRVEL